VAELAGGNVNAFQPTLNSVILGVPAQEKGIRPARALPYELDVEASVNASNSTVSLAFLNTGRATAVFHVRSGNPADTVRAYTVEPGKTLTGAWNTTSSYHLSVYGPNGFVRYFNGSIGSSAAILDIEVNYGSEGDDGDRGSIQWKITNAAAKDADVSVLDAYTGNVSTRLLHSHASLVDKLTLEQFYGWYDLIITVEGDPTFKYRLAGHVETGKDSFSDPALGGLVTLKG
jgi:phospholipase C